jgi:hypothetical protein
VCPEHKDLLAAPEIRIGLYIGLLEGLPYSCTVLRVNYPGKGVEGEKGVTICHTVHEIAILPLTSFPTFLSPLSHLAKHFHSSTCLFTIRFIIIRHVHRRQRSQLNSRGDAGSDPKSYERVLEEHRGTLAGIISRSKRKVRGEDFEDRTREAK